MISNKTGRFLAVPNVNGTIWQQMVGDLDAKTGYIYKWQNTTGHSIIIKDFYLNFLTHSGTATNAVCAFIGSDVEPAALPVGTLIPAVVVDSNSEAVVGVKDIWLPKDFFIQVAMSVDAGVSIATPATAAAVTGVVGLHYQMIPNIGQIA